MTKLSFDQHSELVDLIHELLEAQLNYATVPVEARPLHKEVLYREFAAADAALATWLQAHSMSFEEAMKEEDRTWTPNN